MRVTFTLLVFIAGILLSVNVYRDGQSQNAAPPVIPPLAAPQMSINTGPLRLSIAGTSASAVHETALQRQAIEQFGDTELQTEFLPGVIVGKDWEVTSGRLLFAVASMESAEARMTTRGIEIRGVTADPATTTARINSLHEQMPAAAELHTDIIVIRSAESLDDLCRKSFSSLVLGPVSFAQSSAELRPASFATLDRITEFAHDCPSAVIVITGHTDARGNEAWNRKLSLARAQAVADRIAGNGIDPRRLLTAGAGSSEPIADNATAYGRELNRRIEFELR
jgi:outer membrane protein OmpA-like peptidoglycan-associated protein